VNLFVSDLLINILFLLKHSSRRMSSFVLHSHLPYIYQLPTRQNFSKRIFEHFWKDPCILHHE